MGVVDLLNPVSDSVPTPLAGNGVQAPPLSNLLLHLRLAGDSGGRERANMPNRSMSKSHDPFLLHCPQPALLTLLPACWVLSLLHPVMAVLDP